MSDPGFARANILSDRSFIRAMFASRSASTHKRKPCVSEPQQAEPHSYTKTSRDPFPPSLYYISAAKKLAALE